MSSFWEAKVGPMAPVASEAPRAYGEAYRAHRRQFSASGIYAEAPRPQGRPSIYVPREQKQLQDYRGSQRDPLAARPGETPEAHRRRILSVARALPKDEVEAMLAAIDEGAQSHQELRGQLESRQASIGLMAATPQERAAMVGRHGGRVVQGQGHTQPEPLAAHAPMSMAEVNARLRLREEAMKGQEPQHTDLSALRSTGSGFIGVDR
jgi:hypothetical protein